MGDLEQTFFDDFEVCVCLPLETYRLVRAPDVLKRVIRLKGSPPGEPRVEPRVEFYNWLKPNLHFDFRDGVAIAKAFPVLVYFWFSGGPGGPEARKQWRAISPGCKLDLSAFLDAGFVADTRAVKQTLLCLDFFVAHEFGHWWLGHGGEASGRRSKEFSADRFATEDLLGNRCDDPGAETVRIVETLQAVEAGFAINRNDRAASGGVDSYPSNAERLDAIRGVVRDVLSRRYDEAMAIKTLELARKAHRQNKLASELGADVQAPADISAEQVKAVLAGEVGVQGEAADLHATL